MKTLQPSALTELERTTLDQAVGIIRKFLPDAKIILYGSRARGEAREDSDYDILVITDSPVSTPIENAMYDKIYDILLETDQWVSVFFMDRSTWDSPVCRGSPFYAEICRDGSEL